MATAPGRNQAVNELFTRTAGSYARLFLDRRTGKNHAFRDRLRIALDLARESSGSLLDCATGSGEIAAAVLAEGRFQRAWLVDQSPAMLDLARSCVRAGMATEPGVAVDFVCDDVFRFMAASRQRFDLVLCLGLIAHTGRLAELLSGVGRLLERGGRILLQTAVAGHPGTRIERLFSDERFFRRHGYHHTYFHDSDIRQACRTAGLVISSCRRHVLGIPYGDKVWPWGNYQLERVCRRFSAVWGAEALYVLEQRAPGTAS